MPSRGDARNFFRSRCWSHTERGTILKTAQGSYESALILPVETGTRIGELKHHSPQDIDFNHKVIHIRPKDSATAKTSNQRAVPMNRMLGTGPESVPGGDGYYEL